MTENLQSELDLNDVQTRYLNLLIENGGYKPKWRFELFGKSYVWLISPSGQWIGERLPDSKENND